MTLEPAEAGKHANRETGTTGDGARRQVVHQLRRTPRTAFALAGGASLGAVQVGMPRACTNAESARTSSSAPRRARSTHDIEQQLPIHPEYAAKILDDSADDDAVFTVDTGMNNVWAARYITPNGRRRVIGSFRHGSMANALPHAIGAQLAYPGRQAISMSGDGGLAMLLGELLTVALYRLPVRIVVFNNSALGMVKLEMLVDGLPDYQADNGRFDYAAIARAAGIHAIRVEQPAQVQAALSEALAHLVPRSSTWSPTPTRSRSNRTSRQPRSEGSLSPPAGSCSRAASEGWSSWRRRTSATPRDRRSGVEPCGSGSSSPVDATGADHADVRRARSTADASRL